jgi:hypothetical protein
MHRVLTALTALALLALAVSCGDPYGATNPYDPDFPVTFTITGPDTLFSLGETARYTATTDPAFPDSAFRWADDTVTISRPGTTDTTVDGRTILVPGSAGAFTSIAPPLEPATVSIAVAALIGSVDTTISRFVNSSTVTIRTIEARHVGYKTVVVTQRLTRISLRCPDTRACDSLAVGGTWSVWVDGFDARGLQIASLRTADTNPSAGPPIAVYTVRDTTIATLVPAGIRAATVTALKSGTTWIVGARGALSDSLQLVVR